MAKKEQSYQELKSELDRILVQLQHEDTDIDEAIVLHKQGQEVLARLDAYLAAVGKDVTLEDSTS